MKKLNRKDIHILKKLVKPHMDDPDSSSAGLPDDIGPGTHLIEVVAGNATGIRRALEVTEASAHDHGAALEVVDNDDD